MRGIAEILRGIGEPPAAPFAPAPFQQAALDALGRGDVLVSAPTGSGKTWIAEQEIARLLGPLPPPRSAPPIGDLTNNVDGGAPARGPPRPPAGGPPGG
jgi:hypothetical protein